MYQLSMFKAAIDESWKDHPEGDRERRLTVRLVSPIVILATSLTVAALPLGGAKIATFAFGYENTVPAGVISMIAASVVMGTLLWRIYQRNRAQWMALYACPPNAKFSANDAAMSDKRATMAGFAQPLEGAASTIATFERYSYNRRDTTAEQQRNQQIFLLQTADTSYHVCGKFLRLATAANKEDRIEAEVASGDRVTICGRTRRKSVGSGTASPSQRQGGYRAAEVIEFYGTADDPVRMLLSEPGEETVSR